jgi:hypothetical protein
MDHLSRLSQRLQPRPLGPWDVVSTLGHFALINYALPKERLAQYIPADRFEIPEFNIGGQSLALMSAVPFLDIDFHFAHFFPFLKFQFGQTNYRVYVIDKRTGEQVVWFFGTTLGSPIVYLPRWLWRIPWHLAAYQINCRYNSNRQRYDQFNYQVNSAWGASQIDLEDTGQSVALTSGFGLLESQTLILTHPVEGFFYRLDGKLGHYSVWHTVMKMTQGRARNLYFGLYERLGLLSKDEMQTPHSIFICPEIEFKVFLPPTEVRA